MNFVRMFSRVRASGFLVALALTTLLASCGGGGGGSSGASIAGTGGGTGGTGVAALSVSEGVMVKGSVIVNGVRFDDSSASVTIDDSPRTTADLKNGMVVKVKGVINDDQTSGTAQRIEVENEARGTVQAKSPNAVPPFFTVLGQKVIVDEATVFANITGATLAARVDALAPSASFVEVHGQRDAAGNILASRVELVGGGAPDELRGIASAVTATTFTLSGIPVTYSASIVTPAGATIANGQLLEVHGSFAGGVFTATRVDREDLEDSTFTPDANGKFEVEGFVTGFTVTPGNFFVNGRAVQTTASTRFEGGSVADLVNNAIVEAEGPVVSGVIRAEKIAFKRTRVILAGVATAINTVARTVTLLGRTVQIDDLTDIRAGSGGGSGSGGGGSGTLASIPVGNRVEMRGYVNTAGTIVAERLENKGTGGGDDIVQARVTAENPIGRTLTLLGVNASLAGVSQYQDVNGGPISESAFYAAVTPASGSNPGTLVKVKGTFIGGTLVATEAEIEN